tara:strand:+ start:343 stop:720 length:378 start_codon:yes stop_codon:yes gene_type:complete
MKDNDKDYGKFAHLFKRDVINQRAIMFFRIYETISSNNQTSITPVDLCLGLYPQNIDLIDFFSSIELTGADDEDTVVMKMAAWLEENHTVFWLLTCQSVDELLEDKRIRYNKKGHLELIKRKRKE